MKMNLPKGPPAASNMNQMLQQARKMQEEMEQTQESFKEETFTVSSGGGVVTIEINGEKKITSLKIQPEAVDPDDVEMLEDLLTAAVNEAIRTVETALSERLEKVTGGVNMPGVF